MAVTGPAEAYGKKRAPGHILVDEDGVSDVKEAVEWSKSLRTLPNLRFDTPDQAGLVAMCWDDDSRDPRTVVDEIRRVAPELYDMVAPDHTVAVVMDPASGEQGTSAEMGGPASMPGLTTSSFPPRTDEDVAGKGVTVGVVDSGIRRNQWLDGAYIASPGSVDPLDEDRDNELDRQAGHGTFITGLILRQAPAATVHVARAFDMNGFVRVRLAANAIVELDRRGADVINLSFGLYTDSNRAPLAHRKALSKLRDTTVVVAAAGNHNPKDAAQQRESHRPFFPAAMNRVVAVAALDKVQGGDVRLAPFSNFGRWVDVAAVGTELLSTFVEFKDFQGWATWSGTSFATPIVTGRIAAAMTDGSGAIVRTAQEARRMVLDDAGRVRNRPSLHVQGDLNVPLIVSSDPSASG